MSGAVLKKYSCDHQELLHSDRISNVANDIETFLKTTTLMSPAATMFVFFAFSLQASFDSLFLLFYLIRASTTRERRKEKKVGQTNTKGSDEATQSQDDFDPDAYKRAVTNDFFSDAFGPRVSELKSNQPHSLRSTFEHIAGGFVRPPPEKTTKETLATVKETMRKKKIRVETKG